jgi:hypothetical protein
VSVLEPYPSVGQAKNEVAGGSAPEGRTTENSSSRPLVNSVGWHDDHEDSCLRCRRRVVPRVGGGCVADMMSTEDMKLGCHTDYYLWVIPVGGWCIDP